MYKLESEVVFIKFTDFIIPLMIAFVFLYGSFKKVDVFAAFIQGAKQGLETGFNILPALIILMTAVGMFKASGALDMLKSAVAPFLESVGFPPDVVSLMLLRPISGSGSLVVFEDIIKTNGPDSFAGRVASVLQGSTETTLYTMTVYYGCVKIKNTRHTLQSALSGDLISFIMSAISVRLFF